MVRYSPHPLKIDLHYDGRYHNSPKADTPIELNYMLHINDLCVYKLCYKFNQIH